MNKKVFKLKNREMSRYFIFQEDAVQFILRATLKKNNSNIITLKNVKKTKILDIIRFFHKHFNFKHQVTHLPLNEKVHETYNDEKTEYI
jgi:FlaA1/EpsC-like NDP-sugar epimerase